MSPDVPLYEGIADTFVPVATVLAGNELLPAVDVVGVAPVSAVLLMMCTASAATSVGLTT